MSKKAGAAIAAAIMISAGAAGVSYAYLTAQDMANNTFDVSQVEIDIIEDYVPVPDPKPGTIIKKAPKIHSSSDTDCYVRVRILFTNDGKNFCEPLNINSGWTEKDGCYYWKTALEPGEETGTLFDQVTIKKDLDERDLDPFDIYVYSEAVLADGKSADEAWSAM